jgi:hypothetical protein
MTYGIQRCGVRSSSSHAWSSTCHADRRTKYRGVHRLPPRGPSGTPSRATRSSVAKIVARSRLAPAGLQDRYEPFEVRRRDRLRVGGRRDVRRAEVRRGVPGEPFDDRERGRSRRRIERQSRFVEDLRVARRVREERVDRGVLVPPAARPAGPVDRAGEHALPSDLQVRGRLRHAAIESDGSVVAAR